MFKARAITSLLLAVLSVFAVVVGGFFFAFDARAAEGWILVETLTPSSGTQAQFSGLDGSTDTLYRIVATLKDGTSHSGNAGWRLQMNDSGTSAYDWACARPGSTSIWQGNQSSWSFLSDSFGDNGTTAFADIIIDPVAKYFDSTGFMYTGSGGAIHCSGYYDGDSNNVTSIEIETTSVFDTGTSIKLFRLETLPEGGGESSSGSTTIEVNVDTSGIEGQQEMSNFIMGWAVVASIAFTSLLAGWRFQKSI